MNCFDNVNVAEIGTCVIKFLTNMLWLLLAAHINIFVCSMGFIVASFGCPVLDKHMSRRWLEANRGVEF